MLEKKKQINAMEFTVIEKIQLAMLTTVVVLTILVLKMMAKHEDTAARGDVGDDDGASSARSLILPRSPSTVTTFDCGAENRKKCDHHCQHIMSFDQLHVPQSPVSSLWVLVRIRGGRSGV